MAIVALQLVTNSVTAALIGNVPQINGGDVQITSDIAPLTATSITYFDDLKAQGAITTYTALDMRQAQSMPLGGHVAHSCNLGAVDPASYLLEAAPVFTEPAGATLRSTLHGDTVVINTTL